MLSFLTILSPSLFWSQHLIAFQFVAENRGFNAQNFSSLKSFKAPYWRSVRLLYGRLNIYDFSGMLHPVVGCFTSCPLCRTTTISRREDRKRKREEEEKAKAESKLQQDKLKAEATAATATGADGEGGDTAALTDAKSGDTPDAKKAKTGGADAAEAAPEADVSMVAVPEAAEVSHPCAVLWWLLGIAISCCCHLSVKDMLFLLCGSAISCSMCGLYINCCTHSTHVSLLSLVSFPLCLYVRLYSCASADVLLPSSSSAVSAMHRCTKA